MGLSLGTHPAMVAAYGIAIESSDSYSFLMEPVLHGDLITLIQPKVGTQSPSGSPGVSLGFLEMPLNSLDCIGPQQAFWPPMPLLGSTGLMELPVPSAVR